MKKLSAAVLVLVAIAGAGLFWLSGSLDGLIKSAVASYGNAMTKAEVNVGAVKIAPADGKGTISDLLIGNPPGFKTAHAMKVGRIDLEVDLTSIPKDVIVVRRIAIQKNIASYLGPSDSKKDGKKLIVEELTIRDARAQASAAFLNGKTISIPLPDITLKNLGKAKGGISPGELGQEVAGALKAKLTGAVSFDRLMKSTGEVLESAGGKLKGLLK